MKQSPYQLHHQTVPVFKFKFLYYVPHQKRQTCVYYGVFQTSLHMKRKLTLRNINGHLYCCYHKSPYHILVFMFKKYIPHRQTDTHTYTHTHKMYIITIILMLTYEIKSTRGLANWQCSRMDNNKINEQNIY